MSRNRHTGSAWGLLKGDRSWAVNVLPRACSALQQHELGVMHPSPQLRVIRSWYIGQVYVKFGRANGSEGAYWTLRHPEWGGTRGYNICLATWNPGEHILGQAGLGEGQGRARGDNLML